MKPDRNLTSFIHRATALAMLSAFLFILGVQAFHHHRYTGPRTASCENNTFVHSSDKCTVCDYLVHQQNAHGFIVTAQRITPPITQAVTLLFTVHNGLCTITPRQFTNKGPPAV
jgi:hypothetical protein